MLRRTHRRIYVRQGEAYRREIEEARAEARRARDDLRRFADGMVQRVRADKHLDGTLRILVELDPHVVRRETPDALLRLVAERVMHQLVASRDWRGDLRQTEQQRRFG